LTDVTRSRWKTPAEGLLLAVLLVVLFVAVFQWNWLRGPINRAVSERTGREFAIRGDLDVKLGWPVPHVTARDVTFANPAWAKAPRMIEAGEVEIGVDLLQLLKKNIFLREVRVDRPVVVLEQSADGRKNWLLDKEQSDEGNRVRIGKLTLNQGSISYDDVKQKTSIHADVSSGQPVGPDGQSGVVFTAKGKYKNNPLTVKGSGGSVLALHDESTPYPLKVEAQSGKTFLSADGTVTGLIKLAAVDMKVAARGASLADLFPLIGIALPDTPAYSTNGRLVHTTHMWRYEKFAGKIGNSDIGGVMQVDTGGKRPYLHGELGSQLLDFEDLGPLIGTRKTSTAAEPPKQPDDKPALQPVSLPKAEAAGKRVLPDVPFRTDRWDSVDANVTLKAKTIRRAEALPIENLSTRILMRDSVLTLDPLTFGVAGGQLSGLVALNGQQNPIQARARIQARKMQLPKLFPTIQITKASVGQVDGSFDLAGHGNSVADMLASADGKVALVVDGGQVSRLMMETVGLHLWEILRLKISGDQTINIRCVVADFGVTQGVMKSNALVFDTDVTNVLGSGTIDLRREQLDLTFDPETKRTSPISLQSPIYIRGPLGQPSVGVNKGIIAARGAGALALMAVNPLLALLPLIDAGPGPESQCAKYIREARDGSRRSRDGMPGAKPEPGKLIAKPDVKSDGKAGKAAPQTNTAAKAAPPNVLAKTEVQPIPRLPGSEPVATP